MKNILFVFLTVMITATQCLSQEYTALYSQKIYTPGSSSANASSSNVIITYERLNVKENVSYYFDTTADTCRYSKKEWYNGLLQYVDRSKEQTLQFFRSNSNKATTYSMIYPEDWEVDTKSYRIDGYKTVKVTGQMDDEKVDIYYCPDFPTVFGPSIYSGLPGLVVRVDTPIGNIQLVNIHEIDIGGFPDVDFSQLEIVDNDSFKTERSFMVMKALLEKDDSQTKDREEGKTIDGDYDCVKKK
ncbi:GLPGLI family protein [Membranihabitans marinus]|uniref:GLPGLI family protein n=1 Tax=Membranihabitans marinus TaxID=1227546 RepID=UPI001F2614F9|nr:GLPGLI family protein [Membranihabitans marinus]